MSFGASPVHAREANKEVLCIARTISGEAKGESIQGQILVGLVIRARAHDTSNVWPSTFCGVVFQKNQFYGVATPYQTNPQIEKIAREIANGKHSFSDAKLPDCVRYFAKGNQSFMREVGRVGGHVFGCPDH